MPKLKLTKAAIEALSPPANGDTQGDIVVGSNVLQQTHEIVSNCTDEALRPILTELASVVGEQKHDSNQEAILAAIAELAQTPEKSKVEKLLGCLSVYATVGNVAIVTAKLATWSGLFA